VSRLTFVVVLVVAVALLVVGLVLDSTALALIGLLGGVVVAAVWALAAGGDWLRDASAGRFRRDGR
jgi:TRAP-type C4-dicarboxylate transport system permease large subunit